MRSTINTVLGLVMLISVAAMSSCGGSSSAVSAEVSTGGKPPMPSPQPTSTPQFQGKIDHVVIIIQENRSFDNMFHGYPGADTADTGKMSNGQTVTLTSMRLDQGPDVRHRHWTWWVSWDNGAMDGFDIDRNPNSSPQYAYQYVQPQDLTIYWQLAQRYVLADRMFQSASSGSYASHLYLVAAQSDLVIANPPTPPWGCDSAPGSHAMLVGPNGTQKPGPFPCFTYPTLADELDRHGIEWNYYTPSISYQSGIWNAFDSYKNIRYGPDWQSDVISPETQVLTDIAAGRLAQVTWVVPSGVNSDHPGSYSKMGPQWVGSIVDAIGHSTFWKHTAIFITWDDWGGWYDHVPPPQLDTMGLGFRVPLLVVSPYAKHGYVSHVQHEFGSILHFTEEAFGLPTLGQTDARADDLSDCFDFTQSPSPFAQVRTRLGPAYFETHIGHRAPDDDL